jgi:hypothetical protein
MLATMHHRNLRQPPRQETIKITLNVPNHRPYVLPRQTVTKQPTLKSRGVKNITTVTVNTNISININNIVE